MYTKNQSTIYRQQTISSTQYVDLVIFSRQKIKIFNKKKDFLAKIKPFVEMLEIFRFFIHYYFGPWYIIHIFCFSKKKNGAEIVLFFAPNQHRAKKNVDDLTYFNIAINSLYSNIDQDISIIWSIYNSNNNKTWWIWMDLIDENPLE